MQQRPYLQGQGTRQGSQERYRWQSFSSSLIAPGDLFSSGWRSRTQQSASAGSSSRPQGGGNETSDSRNAIIIFFEALYGHHEKTFQLWEKAGIKVPPCFIVVCNNTSTSKFVDDYISGFHRKNEDGSTTLENGRLALFRNFDETTGNPLPRPNTILIDSEQLEAGDALDDNFRDMAADEIDRFRREKIERTGDAQSAEKITDQELLREVMNTVGKFGQLGGSTPRRPRQSSPAWRRPAGSRRSQSRPAAAPSTGGKSTRNYSRRPGGKGATRRGVRHECSRVLSALSGLSAAPRR
jgi:hypothetical protein